MRWKINRMQVPWWSTSYGGGLPSQTSFPLPDRTDVSLIDGPVGTQMTLGITAARIRSGIRAQGVSPCFATFKRRVDIKLDRLDERELVSL